MASRNAESHPEGGPATHPLIERIPLTVRRVACYLACVVFILGLLPYLADRLGHELLPASWHFEIGWWRIVGAVIFVVCLVLYTASSITLMRYGRGAYIEFDPPKEFVAVGPFRWCRNPIAACVLGMVAGEALAFSSTGIALFLLLIGLPLAQAQVVLLEEPLLEKRFGQAYREYRARVPRWIPRPPRKESS